MRTLFVGMSLVLFTVSPAMPDSSFAASRSGVLAKFRQLPVVQRAVEVWQGTGSSLARKALAFGMLAAVTCGQIGCSGREEPENINRENILQEDYFRHSLEAQNVFLFADDGRVYLGHVLGGNVYDPGDWYFVVRLTDGTEEIVHEDQIGGLMITDSSTIGAPVEIIGDTTDEILTGVVKSVYGNEKKQYNIDRSYSWWEYVAEWYLVRLDSGEERLVPAGSIVAWLNY